MDLIASSGTESAELIGLRLRQSGLWLDTALDTARQASPDDRNRDDDRNREASAALHNQTLEAPGPSPRRYLTLKLSVRAISRGASKDAAGGLGSPKYGGAISRGASKDAAGGLGSPKYGGLACLAAHAWAVGSQLRAIREAVVVAASLKRSLVLPRLTCHCDRDPSGTLSELLTTARCQLPTAEAEHYLPFECPLEHLLNLVAWTDAASRDAIYTLLPASTVLPAASTPLTPAALATALARAGAPASQPLDTAGEEEPTAVVLELAWPTTGDVARPSSELGRELDFVNQSAAARQSSELGRELDRLLSPQATFPTGSELERVLSLGRRGEQLERLLSLGSPKYGKLERLLSLGPAGGWCISCATVRVPPSFLAFGDEIDEIDEMARSPDAISDGGSKRGGGAGCRFCLNFTRLLALEESYA